MTLILLFFENPLFSNASTINRYRGERLRIAGLMGKHGLEAGGGCPVRAKRAVGWSQSTGGAARSHWQQLSAKSNLIDDVVAAMSAVFPGTGPFLPWRID